MLSHSPSKKPRRSNPRKVTPKNETAAGPTQVLKKTSGFMWAADRLQNRPGDRLIGGGVAFRGPNQFEVHNTGTDIQQESPAGSRRPTGTTWRISRPSSSAEAPAFSSAAEPPVSCGSSSSPWPTSSVPVATWPCGNGPARGPQTPGLHSSSTNHVLGGTNVLATKNDPYRGSCRRHSSINQ